MKSIRTRLTLFFLLICVGCLAIAMAVSSIFSRSALTDTNDRLHEQQAEYYASMIDSWLQENTGDVDAACTFLEAKSLIDEVTIRPVMEQYTNKNVNAINVNVGFENSWMGLYGKTVVYGCKSGRRRKVFWQSLCGCSHWRIDHQCV